MKDGLAIVDGALVDLAAASVPLTDPAVTVGWSVFEALVCDDGVPRHVGLHLTRLQHSADAALIAMPPADLLTGEIERAAKALGGLARVRVTLTGGGRRVVTAERLDPSRFHHPVRAVRGPHRDEPFLGGSVKHGSRAPWIVAVRRSGVDEVLLVDANGRFTEGTTSAIVAVVDGGLVTAPEDGRVLASTTVHELLDRAAALGIPVRRDGVDAKGPWDALYIASVTRRLAPVVELDGVPLPGWDPVGRRLAGLEDAADISR